MGDVMRRKVPPWDGMLLLPELPASGIPPIDCLPVHIPAVRAKFLDLLPGERLLLSSLGYVPVKVDGKCIFLVLWRNHLYVNRRLALLSLPI